jgi:hypothetical protein
MRVLTASGKCQSGSFRKRNCQPRSRGLPSTATSAVSPETPTLKTENLAEKSPRMTRVSGIGRGTPSSGASRPSARARTRKNSRLSRMELSIHRAPPRSVKARL